MMLCCGQILQRSQQEFFLISVNWRLQTCDLSCLTLVTCCYVWGLTHSGQRRQGTASMKWMVNTHAHTMHSLQIGGWGGQTAAHQSFTFHVWEHNKLQIRSVQGYVFGREWTQWKAPVQCLIWFLMEGNICNGNLSLGTEGLFRGFHSLALRETEIDIKAGPAHAYCRSFKWLLWRLAKWPLIRVYPNKWDTIKLFFFLNPFPSPPDAFLEDMWATSRVLADSMSWVGALQELHYVWTVAQHPRHECLIGHELTPALLCSSE